MLTAAQIIDLALKIAQVPNYTAPALELLNSILSDLCATHDLADARGEFNFNFNPALATMFGSGPYPLPLDYLRTSGSSGATGTSKSAWYLYPTPAFPSGQPIYMVPIDLAEFDLYPQFPSQSTPELWATDMGGPLTTRIVLSTTAALTINTTTATVAVATGLAIGQSMAGEGVVPGTTLTNVSGTTITLSRPAAATLAAASVFFGVPPNGFAYPPPLGNYPVTIRYQRQMPDITDTSQVVWFRNEGYLIEELAGRIMEITSDTRTIEFLGNGATAGRSGRRLQQYLDLADDKTNRAQTVQLDLRRFGGGTPYDRARNTKYQGW